MVKYWSGAAGLAVIALIVAGASTNYAYGQRPRYTSPQGDSTGAVPQGTVISMRMDATLSSRTSHVGDKFTATVAIPVYVNGRTAIPAGCVVEGQVTSVTPARRPSKSGTIAVDFDDLILPNGARLKLTGTLTSADPGDRTTIDQEGRVSGNEGNRKVVFIGGGGAVGAVLGGIASRSAGGAVLGGVIGAGAGVGAVLLSKGEEAEVRAGTQFGIQLTQALTVGDGGLSEGGASGAGPESNPGRDRDSGRAADRDSAGPPDRDSGPPPSDRRSNRDYPDSPDRDDRSNTRNPDMRSGAPPADRSSNPDASDGGGQPQPAGAADEQLPLSSAEMVRRAQSALRDQGYYEGEINGTMGPRTSNAIRAYQRDHSLSQTGDLDPATARSLGIIGSPQSGNGRAAPGGVAPGRRPASQEDSDIANPRTGDSGYSRRSETDTDPSARTGGGYSRPSRTSYPDSPPSGEGSSGGYTRGGRGDRASYPDSSGSRDSSSGRSTRGNSRGGGGLDPSVASNISRQAEDLALSYQRALGIASTPQGVQMSRSRYDQADIDLLFALNDFVNAARLYGQLAPAVDDPAGQRQVVLALAREARRTDRVLSTTTTQAATSLVSRWDNLRQDVLRLMDSQNITASDIEEK